MNDKAKFNLHGIGSKKVLLSVSLLLITVLIFSGYICVFRNISQSESFPSGSMNETELKEAVNNAVGPTVITIDRDIQLTEPLTIPAKNDITLTSSNNKNGFYKLVGANETSTIFVEKGGVLRLDGIIVTHKNGEVGRGVEVYFGGTLIMTGGVICNNIDGFAMYNTGYYDISLAQNGGGVYNCGSFSMYGGVISNNTAYGSGSGVYNNGYDFSMYGGKIFNNTAYGSGGGVYNRNGEVILYDGVISGNNAKAGGGIYNEGLHYGNVIMKGGVISDNVASDKGGGVYTYFMFSSFSMSGGEISNNTAIIGGGVCTDYKFTMNGGVVCRNTADTGGGVYVGNGYFNRSGGTVSDNTASYTGDDIYPQK
jgi:hypothetical protein